ncbi:MAG: methyltransferase domain-containing protein [archaeon]
MTFKEGYILKECKNKLVLHIGASAYVGYKKLVKNEPLLQQKLNKIAKKAIGVDFDTNNIEELKKEEITNIYFGDILKNTYDKEILKHKYEVIVFGNVIEHLDNLGLAMQNLKQFCNKNTKIIVITPNAWSLLRIMNMFMKNENVHKDHMFWPSKKTMNNIIKNDGFEIIEFKFGFYGEKRKYNIFKKIMLHDFLGRLHKNIGPCLIYDLRLHKR